MNEKHISVLKMEAISALNIKSDGIYVDETLGYAGHSKEILKKLNEKGFLFAFDKDVDALEASQKELLRTYNNFKLFNTSFVNTYTILKENGIEQVDGILYDLGVSSVEIDDAKRGFSYMKDAKLDMRMDQNSSFSAYDVVNTYEEEKLVKIFREYGEEAHAKKIAKEIIKARSIKAIDTTLELVDIIAKCYPYKEKRFSHPAKKVFQAIRIEVNNELEELEKSLEDSLKMLCVGGRIVVITFHSLEDRIVKKIFTKVSSIDSMVKGLPNIDETYLPDYKIIGKFILPTKEEIEKNPRAKSAKLRIIERVK